MSIMHSLRDSVSAVRRTRPGRLAIRAFCLFFLLGVISDLVGAPATAFDFGQIAGVLFWGLFISVVYRVLRSRGE